MEGYVGLIYATRNCSKALPLVKSNEHAHRLEISTRTCEILKPEVDKMRQFMQLQEHAIAAVKSAVEYAIEMPKKHKDLVVTEPFLYELARVINSLVMADQVKNIKSAWNNDFAMYRRALTNLKSGGVADPEEHQPLYMFLATQNAICLRLKSGLEAMPGQQEVITGMVNMALDLFEREQWVLPDEKFLLLRVMAAGIFLLDTKDDKTGVQRNKRLKLDRIKLVVRQYPVIPLIGDVPFVLTTFLQMAPHFDCSKAQAESEEEKAKLRTSYQLAICLPVFRRAFKQHMATLVACKARLSRAESRDASIMHDVNEPLLNGIKFLAAMTTKVLEQSAWKYANPTDKFTNLDCPEKATDYEKCVRYNYSQEDKLALVETLMMIKSLSSNLIDIDRIVSEHIRRAIHRQLTLFLFDSLEEMIQHATKKKRGVAKHLSLLRAIALDVAAMYVARGP